MHKTIWYGVIDNKGRLIYVDKDKAKAEKVAKPTDEVVPMEKSVDSSQKTE